MIMWTGELTYKISRQRLVDLRHYTVCQQEGHDMELDHVPYIRAIFKLKKKHLVIIIDYNGSISYEA